jgi:hypothetical protein
MCSQLADSQIRRIPVLDFLPRFGYNQLMPLMSFQSAACLAVSVSLLLTGCSRSETPVAAVTQSSQGITATFSTYPSPAHTGDDTLIIMLKNAATQQPIGDANVTASAESLSPRLPGPSVSGRAQGNGLYNVPVVLGVASSYQIHVDAQRPGFATATFLFPVDVPH